MYNDEIISIEKIEDYAEGTPTIDITTDGNHYFYANDILTHNSNSDVGLEDTSESFGLPATADFMVAMIATEELEELGQVMFKQLKNRYNDTQTYRKFVVGIDRSKMRLFDVEQDAQVISDSSGKKKKKDEDKSVMDNSSFGERQKEDDMMKWSSKKIGRKDFSGFNV